MSQEKKQFEITGRKVALFFVGAFAIIIGANLALVYSAIGSFPGLETRAPYVESLSFETRREAQEKLNWSSTVSYKAGEITLTLTEPGGGAVVTPNIGMVVGRATSSSFDQEVELHFNGRSYVALKDMPAGNWQAKITATALDGTDFRRTLSLYIRDAS